MAQTPRLFVALPFVAGQALALPPTVARHVQVLRLQPGDAVQLFNGQGHAHEARITTMGRSDVMVQVEGALPAPPALLRWGQRLPSVTLAVGMPANDRMDWLVEKATELGVMAIVPVIAERSVLRMRGERADKKRNHWQAVAVAASEQSGRLTVPHIHEVCSTTELLRELAPSWAGEKWLLSLASDARAMATTAHALWQSTPPKPLWCLSGPEGGLTDAEERAARAAGFVPVSLGPWTLRADTAPAAVLAGLAALAPTMGA